VKWGGICYSKEMQDQAAPPRFRGNYPHDLSIDIGNLPRDRYVREGIQQVLGNGLIKQDDKYIGKFPKLIISIKDPEIMALVGENLENFDDIDCQDIRCTCSDKPRYLQLFADTSAERDSILYNNCKRTIFAAAKRQIKSAPVPESHVCEEFISFAKQKICSLVGDDLLSFGYSYNQWYNHLTLAKQKRMDAIHEFIHGNDPHKEHYISVSRTDPKMFHYEAICKVEVQGTDGKPRMVCSIPDLIKYVMGPICWKLEEVFAQKVPSYCGGMNLTEMQDKINHYIDEGFCIVAEGDGSAFDNTQDVKLKEIDRFIYETVAPRVHHVPIDLFRYVSQAMYKVMDVIHSEGKNKQVIMSYAVLGTVFSGDCDTTLMNTLRMGLYNWFTNEKCGFQFGNQFICFSKGDDFTNMYKATISIPYVKLTYRNYWLEKPDPKGPSFDGCDERMYGLGQILKFIEFGRPNAIKFCSLRAWYTDYHSEHIFLTRDPGKFFTLSKYSRKALHMTDVQLAQYCYDQALALKTQYRGIKYFDDMANMYIKVGKYYDTGEYGAMRKRIEKDRRVTLPLEAEECYNGYSYAPRKVMVHIVGSYWETMQRIERDQVAILPPRALLLVNEQINAEFSGNPICLLAANGFGDNEVRSD
jgi:hypothetical protein